MDPLRRDDDLARRLEPRFEWIRHLGRGGHGRVELVHDRMRDRPVALKLLTGKRAGASDLKREFRIVRDLSHPNLVAMFELVLSADLECIVFEYVDGDHLLRSSVATETRAVTKADAEATPTAAADPLERMRLVRAFLQLVDALDFLEANQLVHGDLKPENVIVENTGRVVVLDFGIARLTGGSHARPIGTLAYMAPEQLTGSTALTSAVDRYAFGILLFQALHGYLPFVGTTEQVRQAKARGLSRATDDPLDELACALLSPDARPGLVHMRGVLERELPSSPTHPAAKEQARSSFVGREKELARLRANLRPAAAPICLLLGPPGLGKTTLLDRFCREEASRVVRSRCYANESIRWNAVDGLIDDLGALTPAESCDALALLFPAIRPHSSEIPGAATVTAIELVRRAARELGAILRGRGRTLVVVDDAQWADADSMGLLTQLLAQDEAIALVIAMRGPDPRSQRLAHRLGASGRRNETIELGPLGVDEAGALADALSIDPGAVAAAGGIPFLIEELAWASGRASSDTSTLLGARLDAVPPAERRLLELLAVNESPLTTRLLLQMASGVAPKTLHALVAERLCRIDREVGAGERFDVYHDVLRQHLLGTLTREARLAIHAELATAMIDARASNEDIARHLLGAGDARARAHVEAAADDAENVLAFDRAAGWLRHLLELAPSSAAREIHARLAECHRRAENHPAAAEALERLAMLEEPERAVDTRRRAAEQWLTAGELERGLEVLRELSVAGKLDGYRVARHGAFDFARGRLQLRLRGTTPRRETAPSRVTALCNHVDLAWTISGCFMLVDPLRAGAIHALGMTKALQLGDAERAFRALVGEATYSGAFGGWSRRRTDGILAQIERLAAELDDDHYRAIEMGTRSIVEVQRGNLRDGVALAPVALARLVAASKTVGFELMSVRHFYMYALFYLGSFRELTAHVEAEYRDASARRNRHRMSDVSLNHATIAWLLAHGPEVARERASEASTFWDAVGPNVQRYYAAVSRITVALWENDYDEVWRIVVNAPKVFLDAPVLVAEGLRADMLHTLARAAVAHAAEVRTATSFATALGVIGLLAVDPSPLSSPLARLALAGLASAAGASSIADRIAKRAVPALTARGLLGYAALAGSVENGRARTDDAALARVLAPGLAPR